MKHEMIRRLEEISMNAWPSLQTTVYDGWLLRFADGFTKRANSVNPIYASQIDVHNKIEYCEAMYATRSLKTIFKLTPAVHPGNLDEILRVRGYRKDSVTSFQVCKVQQYRMDDTTMFETSEVLTDQWLGWYMYINSIDGYYKHVISAMLENIPNKRCFVLLHEALDTVACGLGVLDGDLIGLFDITVSPECRNKGYGQKLVNYLLYWGTANGATRSYLQVVADNVPALNLYAKFGFKEEYTYWYRICTDVSEQ